MSAARWILGTELCAVDQVEALGSFVHRFTGMHVPDWARQRMANGKLPKVQFATDREWLENTRFAVRADGRRDRRVTRCESSPTWPEGKGGAT